MNMTRRQVVQGAGAMGLGLLASCGRLPGQAPAPSVAKVHRLGWLNGSSADAWADRLDRFRQGLGELGYVEGQNLAIEYRWGNGNDPQLAGPAKELAQLPVDLFVVPSTVVARIARDATTTVPIVMVANADAVEAGLAASYARPGGNVTGVASPGGLVGKRLQLLKEAVPSIARVAVAWDVVSNSSFPAETWEGHARAVGVEVHPLELRAPDEWDRAFEAAAREGTDALIVGPGPLVSAHRVRLIQLANRVGWPAMYYQRPFVQDGGLMSYEASLLEGWRRAAGFVDKILKGANPADIPIEQPTRFDLVINLRTAQALGLTIPHHVLLQATEVIQ
jgi:putative tryptophan/tyrosine transport system substrate-binding protein